ncbi:hypothetical protein ACM28P_01200 [Lactobacillus crispatus]|uniref:hypothetical protein n=1 Tax=Lactobacillus crispatus TaxID=47770 RepID=UPI0039F71748
MTRKFIDGEEIMNKKDFDKKVNIDKPMFQSFGSEDQFVNFINDQNTPFLNSFKYSGGKITSNFSDGYMSGAIFGLSNRCSVLMIGSTSGVAEVHSYSSADASRNWKESIAWKSDIQRLEQEIADLKKQIGGVLSRLLTHLFRPRKAVLA